MVFYVQVIPESQPLTPISTSTSDHPRTPQSVRSLDSEPMIPPPPVAAPTSSSSGKSNGRKRKLERAGVTRTSSSVTGSIDENISAASALHMDSSTPSRGHGSTTSHTSNSHSSPCANNKRQIIVQNDMMESPTTSGQGHGINGNSGHESGASPHTNSDPDSSLDTARWRKTTGGHSQAWDASVSDPSTILTCSALQLRVL